MNKPVIAGAVALAAVGGYVYWKNKQTAPVKKKKKKKKKKPAGTQTAPTSIGGTPNQIMDSAVPERSVQASNVYHAGTVTDTNGNLLRPVALSAGVATRPPTTVSGTPAVQKMFARVGSMISEFRASLPVESEDEEAAATMTQSAEY